MNIKKWISIIMVVSVLCSLPLHIFADNNVENRIQKIESVLSQSIRYDKNQNPYLENLNVEKLTKQSGISKKYAESILKSANDILNQIHKEGLTINNDGYIVYKSDIENGKSSNTNSIARGPIGENGREGSIEVNAFEHYSYFGSYKTEKMLDNISLGNYIFGGISVVAFKFTAISVAAGIAGLYGAAYYDSINGPFRESDYKGVVFHTYEIPMDTDISEVYPWYDGN